MNNVTSIVTTFRCFDYKKTTGRVSLLSIVAMIVCSGCARLPELPTTISYTLPVVSAAEEGSEATVKASSESAQSITPVSPRDLSPEGSFQLVPSYPDPQFTLQKSAEPLATAPESQIVSRRPAESSVIAPDPQFVSQEYSELSTAARDSRYTPQVTFQELSTSPVSPKARSEL